MSESFSCKTLKLIAVLKLIILTISESFNSYFSKVGLDLSEKLNQHDTNSYKKFLPKFNSSSFFIQPTSETEVIQLIHSLKNKNS